MASASARAEDVHGEGAGRRGAGGQQGAPPGGHLRHPHRHRDRALAPHVPVRGARHLPGDQPGDAQGRDGDDGGAQPPDPRRHPVHVHRRRAELHELPGGGRHHRRDGGGRRRRGVRSREGADPQARDRGPAVGADLHPRGRRHPLEPRRRRRLPRADPPGGGGLHQRRPPPARRAGGGVRGGGVRVPGERLHRARRRHPHGDHERRDPHRRREPEHHADGEPLVLGGLGDRDGAHRRADHRPDRRAPARPIRGRPSGRERRDDGRGRRAACATRSGG